MHNHALTDIHSYNTYSMVNNKHKWLHAIAVTDKWQTDRQLNRHTYVNIIIVITIIIVIMPITNAITNK